MYAFFNNKKYKIINSVQINKSSREVTYSDLTLDFSRCKIEDLPYCQQEIKIYGENSELKFTGFVSDYKLPELNKITTPKKELELSLYSPRQLATKKTVTIIRTAKLSEIINQTLSPLYQEGFNLKEIDITDMPITVNFISRTVEEILNSFSNKYSLYWNIDEFKNITICTVDFLLNKKIKKEINLKNYKKEILGFISLTPEVENIDYGNIINVKNARIFYSGSKDNINITLKNGDRIDFENPLDISLATAQRTQANLIAQGSATVIDNIRILYNNDKEAYITSGFNINGDLNNGLNIKDIGSDDSSGALFVLTMDSTFKNLATGVTYKGENDITLNTIMSQTMLRYANMKLINWYEIEKNAGKLTPSGQIEKILDVNNGWFTTEELIDYVKSTFKNNEKYTNQITIKTDKDNEFKIGDRLEINLKEYFTVGNFIVTDITENKEGTFPVQYIIKLRNTNIFENYIDLFRSSLDEEEQTPQTELEYVVEYAEEETIKEIHEINFAESENNHTLNFALRG